MKIKIFLIFIIGIKWIKIKKYKKYVKKSTVKYYFFKTKCYIGMN